MILGIGLDVVATDRMDRLLAEGDGRFEERIFTAGERAACELTKPWSVCGQSWYAHLPE